MKDSDHEADVSSLYAAPIDASSHRKGSRRVLVAIVLLLAAAAGAWVYLGMPGMTPQKEAAPRRTPPAPEVTVAQVERREAIVKLQSVGTVQPIKSVQIMPQIEGQIVKVGFTDGQTVAAGTVLFEIDPRPYQATLAQAQAQLAGDQANLESARRDLARTTQLAQNGFAARQTMDQQRFRVSQLEAAAKSDQARIESARLDLDRTRIRAPIAGRLSSALQTEGNIVRPGQTQALTSINLISPIDVQFTLPQDQLPTVQARNAQEPLDVVAYSPDIASDLGRGKLVFIDNRVEAATGTVAMKARFPNANGQLWPGQFVNVAVDLERRPNAVVVDSRAVQTGPNGRFVYVVRDGKAEARPIVLLELEEHSGIVSEGLQGGEQVVVDGALKVVPNGAVRIRDPQGQRGTAKPDDAAGKAAATPR